MKALSKKTFIGLAMVPLMALGLIAVAPNAVNAACGTGKVDVTSGRECAKGSGVSDKGLFEAGGLFQTITNVLLFLIGAISVIMLIIGGFRYVVSNGDSSQITNAKNTILYAVIGIIVALLAYAIVGFVIDSFTANNGNGGNQRRN